MNKEIPDKPAFILGGMFIFSLLLLLPVFFYPFASALRDSIFLPFSLAVYGFIFCLGLLLKEQLALDLLFLFFFAGTLFSIDIGFTLKTSQIFALFALANYLVNYLSFKINPDYGYQFKYNSLNLKTFYPFLIFFLTILPSLLMPTIFSDLYEGSSSLRALFNYLFLQVICLAIYIGVSTKENLKKGLVLSFSSFLLVLAFGFFQQIGYYLGFYDPFNYVGSHSVFVDFYGPFLRIAPGTFANEFGEILQSMAITITTFLIFMKDNLSKKIKLIFRISLAVTIISLIINFTRASWFIYLLFLVIVSFIAKPKLKVKILIFSLSFVLAGLIYYINQQTDLFTLIPILDRLNELSDLSGNSAGVRLVTWQESYELFRHSPIIGNGWGTTIETHNVPLELLSETGVSGFFGFYFLMGILLKRFYKMIIFASDPFLKTTALSCFFTLSGCLLFDFTNHGIYHFILWLSISFGLAVSQIIYRGEALPKIN